MSDQSFKPCHRLRKQREFDRVYAGNAYSADAVLVVQGCRNDRGYSRLGLSISRKYGNSVHRHYWKRLIREAFRTQREKLPQGLDLVVRPRRGARADFRDISASLPRLAQEVARRLRNTDQCDSCGPR